MEVVFYDRLGAESMYQKLILSGLVKIFERMAGFWYRGSFSRKLSPRSRFTHFTLTPRRDGLGGPSAESPIIRVVLVKLSLCTKNQPILYKVVTRAPNFN